MSINSNRVKSWRKTIKNQIIKCMGNKCQICSFDSSIYGFDLHHLDPSKKESSISDMITNAKSWKRIAKELQKCILLCAICHREVHGGIKEIPNNYHSFMDYYTLDKDSKLICNCGNPKNSISKYCVSCYHLTQEKIKWPSKEELEILIWKFPTTLLAKQFGVSDKAISKRCIKYNISKPERGYWTKQLVAVVGLEPTLAKF